MIYFAKQKKERLNSKNLLRFWMLKYKVIIFKIIQSGRVRRMVSHRFAKPASIKWHVGSTPIPSAYFKKRIFSFFEIFENIGEELVSLL